MKLLEAVDNLSVYKEGGRRRPHKPLLLLYALSREVQNSDSNPKLKFEFSQIQKPVNKLISEFWNSRSSSKVQYPFWRLRGDADRGIWEISPEEKIEQNKKRDAKVASLKEHGAAGSFSDEIVEEIRENRYVAWQAIQKLLNKYFPQTLHRRILDAVAFDCGRFLSLDFPRKRPGRDSKFRKRVLEAYKGSCAVCGFNVRVNDKPAGLEAAHIKWHCEKGPDTPDNGLVLCATHHELFDLGAFSLSEDYHFMLSRWINDSDGENRFIKEISEKRKINLPEDEGCFPNREYINWHQEAVFKGPERVI